MKWPSFEERFWNKVSKGKDDECWNWTGCTVIGYGVLKNHSKPIKTHRASWIIHFGSIPKGMCVCHKCDNKLCCNPNHLFLGTFADNNHDRDKKGRGRGTFLSDADKQSIQKEYQWRTVTLKQLATKYKVTISYIWRITRQNTHRTLMAQS